MAIGVHVMDTLPTTDRVVKMGRKKRLGACLAMLHLASHTCIPHCFCYLFSVFLMSVHYPFCVIVQLSFCSVSLEKGISALGGLQTSERVVKMAERREMIPGLLHFASYACMPKGIAP